MASKERLYELWMLYYTKVSASAENLTVTPVVAAGPTVSTFRQWHERTRWFSASFCFKSLAEEDDGSCPAVYLASSGTSGLRCRFGGARHDSLFTPLSTLN